MMVRSFVLLCATAVALAVPEIGAAQAARPRMKGQGQRADRGQLEQQFRERLGRLVKERLGLSDEQMARLADVNQRYEVRRRDLNLRDRDVRLGLRQQLMGNAEPNEELVSQLLQDAQRIARERLEIVEAEQAELARFLTAVQRAKYFGIQEQMRQRVDELRGRPPFMDDRAGEPPPGRRGRRPPAS
jgi:hypothetical protein